jgi:ankyrin repeat protein
LGTKALGQGYEVAVIMQDFLDILYTDQTSPLSSSILSLESADDRIVAWLTVHPEVLSESDAFLMTPLHHLVSAQKVQAFLRIVAKFPGVVKQQDQTGKTVLHCAVLTRSADVIYKVVTVAKELLTVTDRVGKSPLQMLLERHEVQVFLDVINMYWLEITPTQLEESGLVPVLRQHYLMLQSFIWQEAVEKGNLRYLVDAREWAANW